MSLPQCHVGQRVASRDVGSVDLLWGDRLDVHGVPLLLRHVRFFSQQMMATQSYRKPRQLTHFGCSSFEVNLAIMCACAPVLQAFVKKFAPRMLRLQTSQPSYGAEASAGGDRTRPRRDSRTTSKVRPKWPQENQSQDGDLANLTYVELSERGKSDEYSNSNRAVAEP